MNRLSWPEYALQIAQAAASRSEDPFCKVGAAILGHDMRVMALGYNGPPAGIAIDWENRDARRLRIIHAEANAMRYIRPDEAAILASTLMPCLECVKLARAQGIYEIYYQNELPAETYDVPLIRRVAAEFGVLMVAL